MVGGTIEPSRLCKVTVVACPLAKLFDSRDFVLAVLLNKELDSGIYGFVTAFETIKKNINKGRVVLDKDSDLVFGEVEFHIGDTRWFLVYCQEKEGAVFLLMLPTPRHRKDTLLIRGDFS